MLDCYRPQYVSKQMWDVVPDPIFVAASGKSGHNKGDTVDLTLATLNTNNKPVPVDMGSAFDLFDKDKVAYPGQGITDAQLTNRKRLRTAMSEANWNPYDGEWWHFSSNSAWDEFLDLPL